MRCRIWIILLLVLGVSESAAYPEYQSFIRTRSGRAIDCALCHTNADGPNGAGPGQIGGLSPGEQQELNRARLAMEPGQDVNSPILNEIGNHIIETVGKKKFLDLKVAPERLAELLKKDTADLDGDGIPSWQEYLDGTHPEKASDGNPWLLFMHNLRTFWFDGLMIVLATAFGLYGLSNLFKGFAARGGETLQTPASRPGTILRTRIFGKRQQGEKQPYSQS
jgi:hypothetical protein